MTTIDPSLYLQNQQSRGTTNNVLGKDDFLKILMAQIQNQNPLDPMKDKEFISQMTQFSSLEQMTNMSQSFQSFMDSQSVPPIIQYSGLIGKEITYPVHNPDTGVLERTEEGVVQAVNQKDGKTTVELPSGESIPVDQIMKVSQTEEV
ncbi:flagellar hook assembly protein FlgD [Halobacillus sp. BBL2006]|uniref:flagellar hook assembly protein FlgD n=1 Tax=Halobacillus sp. BBL2006 TaxID=1543706 RepID=UPI00054339A6|nr:flagellar hook assembly protein FlgD [Halobacillus sp. BBL2006]KHE73293.1 flagellar basal body rod modification protein FlgD [Halobacillus sp. BBL2006]